MRYSVVVKTYHGERLYFPYYTATERVTAMRVAKDQSRQSLSCSVEDGDRILITYVNGKAAGDVDPVVWDDARELRTSDAVRLREHLVLASAPDPDEEAWEATWRDPWRYDWPDDEFSGR